MCADDSSVELAQGHSRTDRRVPAVVAAIQPERAPPVTEDGAAAAKPEELYHGEIGRSLFTAGSPNSRSIGDSWSPGSLRGPGARRPSTPAAGVSTWAALAFVKDSTSAG